MLKKIRVFIKKIPFLHSFFRRSRLYIKKFRFRKVYNNAHLSKGKISFRDEMFTGNLEHYLSVGNSALENIELALELSGKKFEDIENILDLPCGHGRVMRHLVKRVDPQKITGCDLDFEAVEFCISEFGCKGLFSNVVFEKINLQNQYDLIWVGSLFTHLNKELFRRLLKVLIDNLKSGGILIFSAHGSFSLEIIDGYAGIIPDDRKEISAILQSEGFYFTPYENLTDYGISISLKSFVEQNLEELFGNNVRLLNFREKGWDNHHDVYSYIKLG